MMFSVWHCWLLFAHFYILAKPKIDSKLPKAKNTPCANKMSNCDSNKKKTKAKIFLDEMTVFFTTHLNTNSCLIGREEDSPNRASERDKQTLTSYPKMGRKRTKEGNGCHIWLECFKGHGVWKFYANDLPRKREKTVSKQTICTFSKKMTTIEGWKNLKRCQKRRK